MILKSPLIVKQAVDKYKLDTLKSLAGQPSPLSVIMQSLDVTREGEGPTGAASILNLAYDGPVPKSCSTILTAIIGSYEEFLNDTYRDVNNDVIGLIRQAKDLLQRPGQGPGGTAPLPADQPADRPRQGRHTLEQDRLVSLETERFASQIRRHEIERRLATIEALVKEGKDPTPLLFTSLSDEAAKAGGKSVTDPGSLDDTLFPLLLQEQELLTRYGPDYWEVKAVRGRMQSLKAFYQQRTGAIASKLDSLRVDRKDVVTRTVADHVQTLQQQVNEMQIKEKSLQELFDAEHERLKGLTKYATRKRHCARTSTICSSSTTASWSRCRPGIWSRIWAATTRGCCRRRAWACRWRRGPPPSSWSPWRGDWSPASAWPGSPRSPTRASAPRGGPPPARAADRRARPVHPRRRAGRVRRHGDGTPVELAPVAHRTTAPNRAEAEAYRGVRTALYFSTHGERHKVMQVTSPSMGDGKTYRSSPTWPSRSRSPGGKSCSSTPTSRPRVHTSCSTCPSKIGLAEVITGTAELATPSSRR